MRTDILRWTLMLLSVFLVAPSLANTVQLRHVVEEFLRAQTQAFPGKVSFSVGSVDLKSNFSACQDMQAFLPPGNRLWGRSMVGVRCNGERPWTLYVPVTVKVAGEYVVTARALAAGQVISEADLTRVEGDLTDLPPGSVTDTAQAVGHTVLVGMQAGRPLRADGLRQAYAVQSGQSVKLTARGQGFAVSNEGRALAAAQPGQVVAVRTAGGSTVSGVAKSGGVVEVRF
ncbi:MAG: flagellar basal body P-ring formation protein FlgA [Rhodocyclaceae bacterium]|nr:flagellar basal body P-ring formation protein FlgA [Rhodocyclaceae bacterium]MBX3670675.1 flagellar basal body P-ring formation protein FlgA [Rhodocyclaceae bacterium]